MAIVKTIPGYGEIEFPDGTPEEEIQLAIQKLPPKPPQDLSEFLPPLPATPQSEASKRGEKLEYGMYGAGMGAAGSGLAAAAKGALSAARSMGQASEEGRIAAQRATGAQQPGAESRILRGTTEEGASGRARQTGYQIETAQQAARLQQMKELEQAMQKAGGARTLGEVLAEAPGMTASKHGVIYPRTAPAPTTPSVASLPPLERASQMFRSLMEVPVVRYAMPPLALGSAGMDVADIAQQQRSAEPDRLRQLMSGLGILGAGLSMIPKTTPIGLGVSAAVPAVQYLREQAKKFRPSEQPEESPPYLAP